MPENFTLGNPTGIALDADQHVLVFHRADREWPLVGGMPDSNISAKTILIFDRESGKIIESWGENLFIMPHGLKVDNDNNVWVTDVGSHEVFKFSHSGKLLMKLGEAKVAGNDSAHFNFPTDVAVADDGSFYVSDGYGNSRIIKFSASGKYLFEWGTKGNKEGEFDIPHGICLDDKGNVYVADRENKRVQIFNSSGRFLRQWNDKSFGNICAITFDKVDKSFIVVDDDVSFSGLQHNGSDVIIYNAEDKIINRFGRSGLYTGPKCWYHDVAVDKEGNIYIGDILGNSIQKFKRISKH